MFGHYPVAEFPVTLSGWLIDADGHVFNLLDGPWAGCRARTVFWPDDEACDAECCLPAGHDDPELHYDQILGYWRE